MKKSKKLNTDNIPKGTIIYFHFDSGGLGKGEVIGTGMDWLKRPSYRVRGEAPWPISGQRFFVPKTYVVAKGYVPRFDMEWAYIRANLWVRLQMIFYILAHRSLSKEGILRPLWLQYLKENS